MKILVVDDDEVTRRVLDRRLRAANYETAFAFDAISAISAARNEQPDLILLDLGLPAGDGLLVMERLAAMPSLAGIPVIVVSAWDAELNRERVLDAGARAFVEKPFDEDELLGIIRTALGEPSPETSP